MKSARDGDSILTIERTGERDVERYEGGREKQNFLTSLTSYLCCPPLASGAGQRRFVMYLSPLNFFSQQKYTTRERCNRNNEQENISPPKVNGYGSRFR